MEINKIYQGDSLEVMSAWPAKLVDCCVTSPPYWNLRDYGVEGQFGLEKTPEEYVAKMVEVFREVRRVLKPEGTLWVNLGSSYAGSGQGRNRDGTVGKLSAKQKSNAGSCYDKPPTQSQANVPVRGKEQSNSNTSKNNNALTLLYSTIKSAGYKQKDLINMPFLVAEALRIDGWYLRQDIIWHKPNPMPESVTDRCTKAHEYIFLLSKQPRYYYDNEAIKEKIGEPTRRAITFRNDRYVGNETFNNSAGFKDKIKAIDGEPSLEDRNKRSVWTVTPKPYSEAHFATFPPDLITPCILAGCPEGGLVLDPFMGAGTTAVVAYENQRNYIGCELNPEYVKLSENRIQKAKEKYGLFEKG